VAAWAAWIIEAGPAETPNPFGAKPVSYSLVEAINNSRARKGPAVFLPAGFMLAHLNIFD
jgi:hypothetical protein